MKDNNDVFVPEIMNKIENVLTESDILYTNGEST